MATKVEKLTKEDVLMSERNNCVNQMTKLDIDIKVLERTDPEMVIAKKPLTNKSYQEVKARDVLKADKEQRAGLQARLDVIDLLLSGK